MKKFLLVVGLFVLLAAVAYAAQLETEANVTAEWDNETVEFDVGLDNTGAAVDEVRLYVSGLDGVQCKEVEGWRLLQLDDFPHNTLETADLCWYYTSDSLEGAESFEFSADVPDNKTPVDMVFEVREADQTSGNILAFNQVFNWEVE